MFSHNHQQQTNSSTAARISRRLYSSPYLIPTVAIILIIAVLVNHLDFSQLLANPLAVIAGSIGLIVAIHILGITVFASTAQRRRQKQGISDQDENEPALETEGQTIPWASLYDKLVWLVSLGRISAMRRMILQYSSIKTGDRVLDVGCGTGGLALAAAELVAPDGEVYGTDASAKMIAAAKSKAKKSGSEVNFRVDLIESISFPDNHFDVVLNSLVMHHLPDDLKANGFAEIYRVLKPGGQILIVDIEASANSSLLQRISDLVINLHGGHNAMKDNVKKLAPLAEVAGFSDVQVGRLDRQLAFISARKDAV